MRESKSAVDFRLGGILWCEEVIELLLGIDHACVGVTKLFGALKET